MIDELVADPGFILATAGPGLTRAVHSVTDPQAKAAAATYLRAADQLGPGSIAERAAYLELAARQDGNLALAHENARWATGSLWQPRWARWNRRHANRVLVRVAGTVHGLAWLHGADEPLVAVATADSGYPTVAGYGADRVSVHNFWTGETVFATNVGESVWSLTSAVVDGEPLLLAGDARGRLHVWRVADWEQLVVLQAHERHLGAAWGGDVDGRPVVVTSGRSLGDKPDLQPKGPGELTIWDPRTWTATQGPLRVFRSSVNHVDLLPLDRPAILASGDMFPETQDTAANVRAFDLESGEQRFALPTSPTSLASAFSLTTIPGRFARSMDGSIELWEADGPRRLCSVETQDYMYEQALAAVPTELGDLLIVPHGHNFNLYDLETLHQVASLRGHSSWVKYLDVAEAESLQFVLSAADDGVRVWDIADVLSEGGRPPDIDESVSAIARHTSGVLTARADGQLIALDLTEGDERGTWGEGQLRDIQDLTATPGPGRSEAFAIIAEQLASGPLAAPEPMRFVARADVRLKGVACTTVDRRLIVGACGQNGTVTIWDGTTGSRIGPPLVEAYYEDKNLYAVAFTATDPMLVLAAGGNRHVVAWDLRQALAGRAVRVPIPEPHDDHVRDIAAFIHPLGELIVSVGDDRALVVTDRTTGHCWYRPRVHADWIMKTAILPSDPPVIVTGSKDGYVGLWVLSGDALEEMAMIAVGAGVTDLYAAGADLLIVSTGSGIVALDIAVPGQRFSGHTIGD
jgi:WD40 repeat protein